MLGGRLVENGWEIPNPVSMDRCHSSGHRLHDNGRRWATGQAIEGLQGRCAMSTQTFEQEIAARDRLYKPSAKRPDRRHYRHEFSYGRWRRRSTYKPNRGALEALYAIAYTLKFASKKADGVKLQRWRRWRALVERRYERISDRRKGHLVLDDDDRPALRCHASLGGAGGRGAAQRKRRRAAACPFEPFHEACRRRSCTSAPTPGAPTIQQLHDFITLRAEL